MVERRSDFLQGGVKRELPAYSNRLHRALVFVSSLAAVVSAQDRDAIIAKAKEIFGLR